MGAETAALARKPTVENAPLTVLDNLTNPFSFEFQIAFHSSRILLMYGNW